MPPKKLISLLIIVALIAVGIYMFNLFKNSGEDQNVHSSIGVVTMKEDQTIILKLQAQDKNGEMGDEELKYPPSHPQYQGILNHVGGLKPGETKPVPPWPEDITKEQAIEIVKEDVQLGFDTNFYNIEARLEPDGWHVDYSFKNLPHGVIGGGAPHYIVNSETGAVIKKWFDNNR